MYPVSGEQVCSNLLPHGFLTSERQRQIDPIECHPVNLSFPSRPVPPHSGIAKSADILVIPESRDKHTIILFIIPACKIIKYKTGEDKGKSCLVSIKLLIQVQFSCEKLSIPFNPLEKVRQQFC